MRRSHPGRAEEDMASPARGNGSGAPAGTQPPGFILYAISALDDLTGMTWSAEDLRDARLGRDDAILECKLWYGLFAMVSRSRMEAQGVEGAWTVSLESAMRAYVSRGKPPEVLKQACKRHIITTFPGAAPVLLPLLAPREPPPAQPSRDRRSSSSSSAPQPPPRPVTASLFFVLLWLMAAHDAPSRRARTLHHRALEQVEVEGRVKPPPWGHDTWGLPDHVAEVAARCSTPTQDDGAKARPPAVAARANPRMLHARGGAAAGGRVGGGAAVTSSSSPDAAGHSNRVVFLYNRVRRNLLAEEALRAQRQRLLQRAKDAMQQALESGNMSNSVNALEYWVVREEERVERAVAAMDKASTTIEALRGVGKHEQNLWKWLGKGLADLKLGLDEAQGEEDDRSAGRGVKLGLPPALYLDLEASRFYLEWLDKVLAAKQPKSGACTRTPVLPQPPAAAVAKYKSLSYRWLEYLYGDQAPGKRREGELEPRAVMNPRCESYHDVLRKLVAVSQSAMPGWEVLENGTSIT